MLLQQLRYMLRRKDFQLAFFLTLFYAVFCFIWVITEKYNLVKMMGFLDANAMYFGMGYSTFYDKFFVVFPFLVVLPFAASYIDENSGNVESTLLLRASRHKYWISKVIATFIGNFAVIFIPFLVNLLLCNIFLPHNGKTPYGDMNGSSILNKLYGSNIAIKTLDPGMPFPELFKASPFWYNFMFIILLAFLSGVMGVFLLSITSVIKRGRVLLFLPFFILNRIGATATSLSYNKAIASSSNVFTNWELKSYVAPFSFYGQYYPYFWAFIAILCGISIVLSVIWCKSEYKGAM